MLNKARELAEAHGYYLCRQFENEANAAVHTETTAREILADFRGESLHYFVSGFGTGGTLKGVARGLKAADPGIRVVAVEPDNSPVLASGVSQPRNSDGSPAASHPWFRPHLMQGWSPDFLSRLTEEAVNARLVDEVVAIAGADALRLARELACIEGIFAGISAGATLAGALQLAQRVPAGTNIVCMLPDTGERYISTPLFEHIGVDMNDDELALSASTAGCQFGPPVAAAVAAPADEQVTPDFGASRFVADAIEAYPVVMFALEWCEFCWSARNFFKELGVDYHSIDLDSVAFQREERGVRIREVLRHRLGVGTIPQIFVGGVHIGGCTELFASYREGSLQPLLARQGITLHDQPPIDTSRLLPRWMHPRKSA
jgi:cysteine synthase A